MEIKYLQVLVMPNGEVLYRGKHIGWVGTDEQKHVLEKDLIPENQVTITKK